MTKEEAKSILEKFLNGCEGDDFDLLMTLSDEEIFDAIKVSINSLSILPSNIDEAADTHIRRVAYTAGHSGWDWETQDIADAFKAGAEWMKGQMK